MKYDPTGDTDYQLSQILNGGIRLGEHTEGGFLEVVISDSPLEVSHGLGYVPKGFIIISKDAEGDVWAAKQEQWNKSSLWLASNVTNLKVRLFVM